MTRQKVLFITQTLALIGACSNRPEKAEQPKPTELEKRVSERRQLEASYTAKELECSKKRDETAFLKTNGRDAGVAETAAKACYQDVADYREAMMHWDDMLVSVDGTSYRLRFPMEGVYAEEDMVVFRNYRNAIWLVKQGKANSDRALAIVKKAAADWKRAKAQGFVVSLAEGTAVEDVKYRYDDIAYQYAKRELLFTMRVNGKTTFMPSWENLGKK